MLDVFFKVAKSVLESLGVLVLAVVLIAAIALLLPTALTGLV